MFGKSGIHFFKKRAIWLTCVLASISVPSLAHEDPDKAVKDLVDILSQPFIIQNTVAIDAFKNCTKFGKGQCLSKNFSVQNGHKRIMLPSGKPFTTKDGFCHLVGAQGSFGGMGESMGIYATGELAGTSIGEWWIGAGSRGGSSVVASGQCVWAQ